jgi:hypothetical protein
MNTGQDMDTDKDKEINADKADPFPSVWDPTNARALLQWTIDAGLDHLLYGFELGNEQVYARSSVSDRFRSRSWQPAAPDGLLPTFLSYHSL